PTDEVSDADLPQSGYLPNHNMQPSIVGSSSFGILWSKTYNAKERWYAKPLVYTPPGQKQLVFTASNQNWIRTVDAVTGAALKARQVQPPFLVRLDARICQTRSVLRALRSSTPLRTRHTSLQRAIKITLLAEALPKEPTSKMPKVPSQRVRFIDILRFYAVNVLDLSDRPGFPVLIDGHNADNDPARYFIGGTVLQRPSVTLVGGIVYGTFGGHCDLFNYTGIVAGMSGMAPATDGDRVFVVTGNGQGHENKDTPASGRSPLSTLDEVVANFAVSGGKLILQDYFEPYEYIGMDAGDRDLGSGGVALLDPSVFKGTNGVSRIAVTIGKNGKAYIMNADNLGGFKLGPGATDNILQTIIAPNAVFHGGYIYFTPVGYPTLAYKFGLDQKGSPLFSKVGQSLDSSAGRVGVGSPTVTTYKGQPGTGIVWLTDVDGGLKAYKAVPDASGNLVRINIPPTGGLNKFQRPAFGDGRLYVTNSNAAVICMGSPVSIPLNCTSPVDFGDVTIGTTKTLRDANGASFSSVSPGVKTSSLVISTTNGVAQYSNSLPITLQGNEVSQRPFLSLSPPEVDFGGIVVGSPGAATGLDSAFIIANIGSSPLSITGYAWTDTDMDDKAGGVTSSNVTQTQGGSKIGDGFTSSDLPAVGSTVAAGQSLTVPLNFNSAKIGNYLSVFTIWTNGGSKYVLLTGSATTSPIAALTVETSEGGWDPSGIMDFGIVQAGVTATRRLRTCNVGGSPLMITKSKPPVQAELRAENPTLDLHEGQSIPPSECAYALIDIAAAPQAPNNPPHDVSDVWVLNTDDLSFGVHEVEIRATIVSRQLGPTYSNGTAKYTYLGCYSDLNPRQLQKLYNLPAINENSVLNIHVYNGFHHLDLFFSFTNVVSHSVIFNIFNLDIHYFDIDYLDIHYLDIHYLDIHYFDIHYLDIRYIDIHYLDIHYFDIHQFDVRDINICYYDQHDQHLPNHYFIYVPYVLGLHIKHLDQLGVFQLILNGVTNPNDGVSKAIAKYQFRYAADSMTTGICLDFCKDKGTTYAGLEYHRECYCGSSIADDAVANAEGCTMTCMGNTEEICGGSNRMNVYQFVASGSGTSSATSASKSSSSSSLSTTTTSTYTSSTSTRPSPSTTTTSAASRVLTTTPSPSTPSTLTTTTRSSTSTSTATLNTTKGFYSLGCYAEPPSPTRKPMTRLLAADP
ncbi:MAG: hypothetical protein Q9184_007435, partial [Pyrenodesmia sp. 2 TL-2023]